MRKRPNDIDTMLAIAKEPKGIHTTGTLNNHIKPSAAMVTANWTIDM